MLTQGQSGHKRNLIPETDTFSVLNSGDEWLGPGRIRHFWETRGLKLREDVVGLFERLPGTDIVPEPWHPPGVERCAGVEPLDEAARLVGVVAFGDVLPDERDGRFRIIIKADPGQG